MVEDRCLRVQLHDSCGGPVRCLTVLPGVVEERIHGSEDVGESSPALPHTHSLVCLAPNTAAIFTQLLCSNTSYR